MVDVYACLLALALMTPLANRSGIAPLLSSLFGAMEPHAALLPRKPIPPPLPLLIVSQRTIPFDSTGVGYYRATSFTVRSSAPGSTTVRLTTAGATSEFQLGATTLVLSDTTPVAVTVRFRPTRPDSCYDMSIVISDGTTLDTVELHGCAVAATLPFDNDSSLIDFGAVPVGSSRSIGDILPARPADSVLYSFQLRQGLPFRIVRPASGTTLVRPGAADSLIVSFSPLAAPGTRYHDTILCRTNLGDRLLYATGLAADSTIPSLDSVKVGVTSIDFGATYVGTSHDTTFRIINSYNDRAVQVTNVITNGAFEIPDPQHQRFILGALEARDITIRFTPPATGYQTGIDSITFTGVGGATGSIARSVVLTGKGVAAIITTDRDSVVIDSLRPGFCGSATAGDTQRVTMINRGNIAATLSAQLVRKNQGFTILSSQLFQIDSAVPQSLLLQFCGADTVEAVDTLMLYDVRSISTVLKRIPLIHHRHLASIDSSVDSTALITIAADTIDFGAVDTGATSGSQHSVMIRNDGDLPGVIDIDTFLPAGVPLSSAFTIVTPRLRPVQVRAHDSIEVVLEFRPRAVGDDAALWRIAWENGDSSRVVVLKGKGISLAVPPRVRLLSFGNAHERVGRPIRLALTASRDTASNGPIRWDSAVVRIDPMAFLLTGLEPAGTTARRDNGDSTIVVYPAPGSTGEGDSLFTLILMGLSTGRPSNTIVIDSLYAATPVASGTNGVVQLDGCDVDRGLGSSLKPTVGSLLLDASGSAATLVYSTAEGAIPRLTLVSMSGATVMTHDLPPGDGGERSITIALRDVPPGLYLLELRVESDRVVTPIMITR